MTQQKRGLGCCGYGCLALTLMFVVGGGCTAFVGWQAYQFARDVTTTEPLTLPTVPPNVDGDVIATRVETFATAIEAGEPSRLELSDLEINAALAAALPPEQQTVVAIANGTMTVNGAFPLDEIPGFRGRFLNGRITFVPAIFNDELVITLKDFEIEASREVPVEVRQALIRELENQNLLENWTQDAEVQAFISAIDTLELVDNRLILERR